MLGTMVHRRSLLVRASGKKLDILMPVDILYAWTIHVPPEDTIHSRTFEAAQAGLSHFRLTGDTAEGNIVLDVKKKTLNAIHGSANLVHGFFEISSCCFNLGACLGLHMPIPSHFLWAHISDGGSGGHSRPCEHWDAFAGR